MTIDISALLAVAKPWDLKITLNGVDQPVRRLNSADVKRLTDMAKYSEAENKDFLVGLFDGVDGVKPDVEQWDTETAATVLGVILAYYQEAVVRKNAEAAQLAVARLFRK